MATCVLYLQADDRKAYTIRNGLEREDTEVTTVKSAQEAFKIMEQRKVILTVVDANIPDMQLVDFAEKCSREYPQMLLNVFVAGPDTRIISRIASLPCVKKIFLPPWNQDEVIEGIDSTLDGYILSEDLKRRQNESAEEDKRLAETLSRLKESLIRQKYSYNRIGEFFNPFLEEVIKRGSIPHDVSDFIKRSCNKMLELQTVTSIKLPEMSTQITKELESILKDSKDSEVGVVYNCLMGEVNRSVMATIIFTVWMIVTLEYENQNRLNVSVDSQYISAGECEFVVNVSAESEPVDDMRKSYVSEMLESITNGYTVTTENGVRRYEVRYAL